MILGPAGSGRLWHLEHNKPLIFQGLFCIYSAVLGENWQLQQLTGILSRLSLRDFRQKLIAFSIDALAALLK